jgi:hypothetical protein
MCYVIAICSGKRDVSKCKWNQLVNMEMMCFTHKKEDSRTKEKAQMAQKIAISKIKGKET